jgi:ABC-type nitrate/sulfonate/bicarbonate transport system permease component
MHSQARQSNDTAPVEPGRHSTSSFVTVTHVNKSFTAAGNEQKRVCEGGSRMDVFRSVILPGSMSAIIADLKAGVPFALIGVIVGEFIAPG